MTTKFSPVAPTEEVILTFAFANGLADGETLSDPTVTVEVDAGTDPAAADIVASAQTVGTDVLVSVGGMVLNTDYRITVTAPTSTPGKTLTVAGILPVRRA